MIRKCFLLPMALGGLILVGGCSTSPCPRSPCDSGRPGFFSRLFHRPARVEAPMVDVGVPIVTEGPILAPGAPGAPCLDGFPPQGIPTNGIPTNGVGPMPRLVPTPLSQPVPSNP
jgi:hypothetical protein